VTRVFTFVCDQCRDSVVSLEPPRGWRQIQVEGDLGDLCSAECASAWVAEQFDDDPDAA
jgi:hypothetical protein